MFTRPRAGLGTLVAKHHLHHIPVLSSWSIDVPRSLQTAVENGTSASKQLVLVLSASSSLSFPGFNTGKVWLPRSWV